MSINDTLPKTILILAANPKGTSKLRLDEEVREIALGLERSRRRELFTLKHQWAVRPRDIYRSILDDRPQIIHFCGHGTGNKGLVFEDESGETKLVSAEALANLFQLFSPQVECVLLNCCYSEIQAQAINQHIDYVIGMKQGIGDKAAINFAVGFYDALGAGESYDFAFNLGCRAIQMAGISEQLVPVIEKKTRTMTDEKFQQLVDKICCNSDPKSSERLRAINRLLRELQQLPGLLKSSHPYYLQALDKTWEYVIKNICTFEKKCHLSLQESLVKWINGYLYWRIKDLYHRQEHQYRKELSLDVDINKNDENPLSFLDQLSETGFEPPTLSGLDAYIETLRKKKNEEIWQKLELYIEEDPEQILQKLHPRKFPDCNCQLLAKKLLLKDPLERLAQIHREYQNLGIEIKDYTLRYHWNNMCKPCLQKILESLGYSKDEES